jgi:phosphoglycolate phosphatase-like HAD superfamily hydrolase
MSEQPHANDQTIETIAAQLQESHPPALAEIRRTVDVLGAEVALALLLETQQIEAQGGLMTKNQRRRRTPGGVFLKLVRERRSDDQRRVIFPKSKGGGPSQEQPAPRPAAPPFVDLAEALQALGDQYGVASTVKMTVIGRPLQAVERGDVVIVGMISDKAPTFPKGLPAPPKQTKYVVLIARKQWARVAEAIKQADDALIVEGYPAYEPRHAGITVYATSVTTKKQQAARREAQQSAER